MKKRIHGPSLAALALSLCVAAPAFAGKRAAADDDKALIKEALSARAKIDRGHCNRQKLGRQDPESRIRRMDLLSFDAEFEGVCPMCIDKPWQDWLEAMSKGEAPAGGALGVSYMLAGDCAVSNTDPAATAATDDNEWGQEGPHLMLLAPDMASLEGMSHDRNSGAPYVMWRSARPMRM